MKIYSDLRRAIIGGWEHTANYGVKVNQGYWQGTLAPKPVIEAIDFMFRAPMPSGPYEAEDLIEPNMPWADDHFEERISGIPLNPPPSSKWWPFAQKDNKQFKANNIFDHTYPERFWPRYYEYNDNPFGDGEQIVTAERKGIRFNYGDLDDLVNKLIADPLTRQAYFPIWFPEDTGQPSSIRVPCSLGYHFMIRDGRLDIKYIMRSTDMLRHYQDDIYMAFRLAHFVWERLSGELKNSTRLGYMTFITFSAHVFEGEEKILETKIRKMYESTRND